MMLDYGTYLTLTLDPVTEEQFSVLEPDAEILLARWTLERAAGLNPVPDSVLRVLAKTVNGLKAMYDGSKALLNGQSIKSYSDGISSWSFDTPYSGSVADYEDRAKQVMYETALTFLPTELTSRVVNQGRPW